MANRGRSFLFLLLIAAVLGGYVWFVEMKRDPDAGAEAPREKIFTVEPGQIQEVKLTNDKGEVSTLRRSGDRWTIAEMPGAEVDDTEISGITNSLSGLESNRVIDEQPASLAEYGLDKPRITAAFTDASGKQQTLEIGKKTPTGGDLYARTAGSNKVVLIGAWLEDTFNRSRFDLRDKSVLKFDRDAVSNVTLTSAGGTITLQRAEGAWKMTAPSAAPADDAVVEGLLGRLSTARMQKVVDSPDPKTTGLAKPSASVALMAGPTRALLEIGGAAEEGSVYARDAVRDIVFTIDASLADELKKKPEDFRKKEQ